MGKNFDSSKGKKHNPKPWEKQKDPDGFESQDDEVVSDKEDVVSVDSEEEALRDEDDQKKSSYRTGKVQDRDSDKNKLNLGDFHRNNATFKKRNRKVTVKKQIRDIERLLDRTGLPEEMRTAKKSQLVALKKDAKKQREAELFESKYKKIKFTEKKKIIRKMEQAKTCLNRRETGAEERSTQQTLLKQYQDQLIYINNFPVTQKYISLFPKTDDDESKKRRAEAMVKVLQIASHKQAIKDRDLQDDLVMDLGDG